MLSALRSILRCLRQCGPCNKADSVLFSTSSTPLSLRQHPTPYPNNIVETNPPENQCLLHHGYLNLFHQYHPFFALR